jgi:hypothetical protein
MPTKDGLRFLTFRLTFEVERNVWALIPVVEESFFARVRVLLWLEEAMRRLSDPSWSCGIGIRR